MNCLANASELVSLLIEVSDTIDKCFGNPHLLQGLLQICHHLIHYRWSSNSIIGIIILTAACYGWSSSFAVVCGWGVIVFRIGIITR